MITARKQNLDGKMANKLHVKSGSELARESEERKERERERESERDGNEWCALWKLAIVCSLKRLTSHGVTFAWFSLDTDYPRPGPF
jgi:hypothetical protein